MSPKRSQAPRRLHTRKRSLARYADSARDAGVGSRLQWDASAVSSVLRIGTLSRGSCTSCARAQRVATARVLVGEGDRGGWHSGPRLAARRDLLP